MRHNATEPVGVDMKQCKICKKPKLLRKITSNIRMIQINPSHNNDPRIIQSRGAEDAIVAANIGSHPASSHIRRIAKNSSLPCL